MNDNPATSSGPYAAGTFTPDQSVGHLMRQVLNSIRDSKDLSADNETLLKGIVESFTKSFA